MNRLVFLAAVGAVACSSSSGGKVVTQKGRVVEYQPCADPKTLKAVAGATVSVAGRSVTTGSDGTYSLSVPAGVPFTMTVTKTTDPAYAPLTEAEDTVQADYDRGDTQVVLTSTATLLSSALPQYDSTRALLTIELVKTGSCTDLTGTSITVSPSNPDAQTQYPAQCISPYSPNTSATDGIFPAAVVYNLTPSQAQTVTAKSPKCTQVPYPYTDPATGLTYDGTFSTQGGLSLSFVRVFMK